MITIVSPEIYTYGSMVIGGILRDAGYNVVLTKELHADTDTVFVSLHSTLQLIDNNIKKFFGMLRRKMVFVGGPVSAYPRIILGELSNVSCVVVGEGEEIVLDLLERGVSEDVSGIAFRDCNGNIVETKNVLF